MGGGGGGGRETKLTAASSVYSWSLLVLIAIFSALENLPPFRAVQYTLAKGMQWSRQSVG